MLSRTQSISYKSSSQSSGMIETIPINISTEGVPPEENKRLRESIQRSKQKIIILRCVLILTLLGSGALCGYFGYTITRSLQINIFEAQYKAITDQMHQVVVKDLQKKSTAGLAFTSAVGILCPDAAMWPNCSIPYQIFEDLTNTLLKITDQDNVGLVMKLTTQNLKEFEAFAFNFYEQEALAGNLPPDVGVTDVGKHVWFMDRTRTIHRETDGCHNPLDPTDCAIDPVFQFNQMIRHGNIAMFNTHMNPAIGAAIAAVKKCHESGEQNCLPYLSEMNPYAVANIRSQVFSPSSGTYLPIFPANDKSKIVGYCGIRNDWDVTFNKNNVPDYVDLSLVLSTPMYHITYNITHSTMNASGFGDMHEPKFTHYRKIHQISPMTGLAGVEYNITFYPTQAFYDYYIDDSPVFVCVGAVTVIVVTSIIILIYSWLEAAQALEKDKIIEARANFINFISHEIRTPMNIVTLGLQLIRDRLSTLQPPDPSYAELLVEFDKLLYEATAYSEDAVVILSDLLNFNKIEKNILVAENNVTDIFTILNDGIEELRCLAGQYKIKFILTMHPNSVVTTFNKESFARYFVYCDKPKLRHVIRTLGKNSIHFSQEDSAVECIVRIVKDDRVILFASKPHVADIPNYDSFGYVEVEIKSFGGSFTDREIAQFRSGEVTMSYHQQENRTSGIDIHVAKTYVDLSSGKFSLKSYGDVGCSFVIQIPLLLLKSEALGEFLKNFKIEDYIKNILLVDDDNLLRKLLRRQLVNVCEAFHIEEANDGTSCIELFEQRSPSTKYDLLIIDKHMTTMNGPATIVRLKELGFNGIIIGLSGDDGAEMTAAGAHSSLMKPTNVPAILEKCETIIRERIFPSGQ